MAMGEADRGAYQRELENELYQMPVPRIDLTGKPELEPEETHYVEETGRRSRVFRAICGESIHSGEMKRRTSREPSCRVCRRLLDDFDAETL